MPKAVIFDMDGVLVDSMPIHWQAWREAFEAYAIDIKYEDFIKTPGLTCEATALLLGADVLPEAEIPNLGDRQREAAKRMLAEKYPPIPGAEDLIRRLDLAGWRMAIATSGPLANIQLLLRNLPEARRITAFITSEDVQRGKPDPEVFLKAAERLGVMPREAVVIEDSKVGLEAARRGGFTAVALASTFSPEELESLAGLVVGSLHELSPDVLVKLFA